jgi:putative flippase GtrA
MTAQRPVVSGQRSTKPLTTEDTESKEGMKGARATGANARAFQRWMKFNAVGALGMGVQLAVLAGLNRMTSHYLVATTIAIEITLLHNFAWHARYTWRDRAQTSGVWVRCARFHVSNGAVSMAGNLALMPLLVEGAGMPVLAANAAAVVACSVVNFVLGDGWVFAGRERSALGAQRSQGSAPVR